MKNPTHKKLNKSLKYYIICGIAALLLIVILLLLYAWIAKIDILAWFKTKYALLLLGAIIIYAIVGLIIFVKDKIGRI